MLRDPSRGPVWDSAPPPPPRARLYKPIEKVWLAVLGPWEATWLHWNGRRSYPCFDGACPAALHRHPQHWFAFLPVYVKDLAEVPSVEGASPVASILSVTNSNREPCEQAMRQNRLAWLIRPRDNKRGWELVKAQQLRKGVILPPCPDVRACLHNVWGLRPPPARPSADCAEPCDPPEQFTEPERPRLYGKTGTDETTR